MSQAFIIVQSILVFVLLLIGFLIYVLPSGKKKQNLPLCVFLIVVAIHILTDLTVEYPLFGNSKIHLIPGNLIFLYAPLLYFYILGLLKIKHNKKWVHFIPLIIFSLYYIKAGFVNTIFFPFFGLQYIIYTILINRKLNRVKKLDFLKRIWSYFLVLTFGLIWIFAFIANFAGFYNNEGLANAFELISYVVSLLFFVGLIYFTMSQPGLFMKVKVAKSNQDKASHNVSKDEEQRMLKIKSLLEEKKIFQNPDLNRDLLASELQISPQQLSKEINQRFKMNLSELINKYRIEEAKKLLKTGSFNIKEVYYDVGFNSRSAFNTAFKKWVKSTPSEFLKSM